MGGWFGCEKEFYDRAVEGEICADGRGAHERGDAREVDDTWFGGFRLGCWEECALCGELGLGVSGGGI